MQMVNRRGIESLQNITHMQVSWQSCQDAHPFNEKIKNFLLNDAELVGYT
jgi:hypothetical protein